jgi:ribosomal peptide maturation radical SAM protein 1
MDSSDAGAVRRQGSFQGCDGLQRQGGVGLKRVLLLSMPMGALERQALGLSLLKARLCAEGIHCDVRYLTFAFADLIGVEAYCWLSTDVAHTAFAGEWVFIPSLYGDYPRRQTNYVREVLQGIWQLNDQSLKRIHYAQQMAPHFLEHCLNTVPWQDYAIVGFTSTFEQNIASLALAKRIKDRYPTIKIVFGGANWEGEMGIELHQCFPFVDYAFSGEADESFPKFVRLALSGRLNDKLCAAVPGLIRREGGKSILSRQPEPVDSLDSLPIPDYSDYFRDFDRSSANALVVPTLLFEGSRGCWWGAEHHCKFCGLNGAVMKFRAKSPSRAMQEITYLVQRWQTELVQAVDNVVPMQFFRDLFPALSRAQGPTRMFYEIRANLHRQHIETLRDARVLHVQPGIESMNNHVLQLMSKGTTALQNIQVLKWCKECGVQADYNLLYGFPGETDKDYRDLFELLRAIRFLNPPTACGPIRLDRFSPYFREAQSHGLQNLRPMAPYKYLYPFGDESITKIAYYFDYDFAPGVGTPDRWAELSRWVEDWKAHPEPGTIEVFDRQDGTLAILDTRSQALRSSVILQGLDKAVYDFCDCAQSLEKICEHLSRNFPEARVNPDAVGRFLDTLVAHGYMVADGSSYLSLALRSTSASPASAKISPDAIPASGTAP